MKKTIYLVKYIDHDTVEGYVYSYADFRKWLKEHNADRKADGEIVENEDEFDLTEIFNLNE
jgi:hypothetical protein